MEDYTQEQGQGRRQGQQQQDPLTPEEQALLPTPAEVYEYQKQQILDAWAIASQADSMRTQAALDAVMARAQNDAAAASAASMAAIARARDLGQIDVDQARALMDSIQTKGQANLQFLMDRGRSLLQSLTEREANGLSNFIQQAIYDLDRNRQITGPNARAGYSGVNRFAVKVNDQDAMNLPGYKAMQDSFAQQRAESQRMTAADVQLAQSNMEADVTRARFGITAAERARDASIKYAGMSGGGGGGLNSLQEQERIRTLAAADQLERDAAYKAKLDQLAVQNDPSRLKRPTSYYREQPAANPVSQPSQDPYYMPPPQYQEFGHGGVTELARRVAARQRRVKMGGY